ncbi:MULTISPECIES: alpha/beta fold hydrolase [unclassified Rathayibacter]|uniref:alpha/beta fold hydrolase n=1 Tax=unclassified Rathayibacter TaxID=2609250 RepID=UPI0006F5A869|nr:MULTISPECIES: alpha/beta fold hydrolase [unclassified Rathayibacter]KQQ05864.1 hypothetical protein ASF42_04770 [Rathayibacter sp. Leaf294]KQS13721.1 hypothetical protein ASG06_04780 [Rathayibacter sp. Leaf185]
MTAPPPVAHRTIEGSPARFVEYGEPGGRPSVLFVPALGVPLGYYGDLLAAWSARGRHVVAVELRGMPHSSVREVRRQRFGYSALANEDLPAVVREVLGGPAGFLAVGHSLGGQLALLATAAGSISPLGVVAIASGTSSAAARATVLSRSSRRAQVSTVALIAGVLGYWPGDRFGFGGRQPRSLMRDWAHEGVRGRYRLHGDPLDYERALAAISAPVLLLSLEGDALVTQLSVEHLLRRLPASAEHRRLASPTRFHHLRWARREPGPVLDAVEAWAE